MVNNRKRCCPVVVSRSFVQQLFTSSALCNIVLVHIACEHQDEELVQILLAAGSPVDSRDKNGGTPLFTSVRAGGSPAVLRLLLHKDVDVDAAPDGEPTAFALASGMGCLAAVRLLVSPSVFSSHL